METYKLDMETPVGVIEIVGTEKIIQSILFVEREVAQLPEPNVPDVLRQCKEELDAYFRGDRMTFTFPIEQVGTPFQRDVWSTLQTIPFAETTSYRELARRVKRPTAVRAVGATNGRNKLSIVVPCHRVIGSNGKLTGYAGGLWRKEWLLHHEKQVAHQTQ
ncbi:methylated-DNA--[protein]-cysteine S-methyltransferase [Exiguobacterium aestuarii]|uniref:methylated-DNA--[protein]-cysteine S-methyltransferase n=1 Tax=Exiguobacterium aestuarii TaxID=273527 RepID=UPI001CD2AC2F|nr:methylated-DNA--[protein]-cysteine S-methyltransferase [Exiguobacterium aestuarii]MCA0981885.1 methylated-DNA--[protein]-cysteine S-methyltransferase [Exiguobacterium aestuarii]